MILECRSIYLNFEGGPCDNISEFIYTYLVYRKQITVSAPFAPLPNPQGDRNFVPRSCEIGLDFRPCSWRICAAWIGGLTEYQHLRVAWEGLLDTTVGGRNPALIDR